MGGSNSHNRAIVRVARLSDNAYRGPLAPSVRSPGARGTAGSPVAGPGGRPHEAVVGEEGWVRVDPAASRLITVVVAEDHPLMLEAVLHRLDSVPDLVVVATAAEGPELVARFEMYRPDLVVTDYWLPGYTGAQATRRIRMLDPTASVIVFSASDDPLVAAACIEAGARQFVPKTSPGPALLAAIRSAVAPNGTSVAPVAQAGARVSRSRPRLTAREHQVLTLLAGGHTNPDIGRRLYLSPETVKTHVRRIYKKLGVGDRASAVRVALSERLVD